MKRVDRTNPRRRRGSILILVMAMLIVLTSMVLMLARSMRTEELASANYVAEMQADAAAHGAAEYVRSVLNGIQGQMPDDTTLYAQGAQIGPGYFWLLKHDMGNTTGAAVYAFGLTDEQSKVNLNYAYDIGGNIRFTGYTTLSLLPNMTTDLANNIVAWRSASGTSVSGGAESSYYLSLTPPYQAKNNNFETVEELLMVEGITPQILYGEDTNRNGILDANDTDPNNPANGPATPGGPGGLNALPGQSIPGSAGSASGTGSGGNSMIAAPSLNQNFHGLADYVTVYGNGQINLNTAPQEVLQSIAGLSQSQAQAIVAYRQAHGGFPATTTQQQLTAILTQIVGTPAIVQILAGTPGSAASGRGRGAVAATPPRPGRVTTRTNYCSADIVATDSTGRAFKRYQVVYKTNTTPPSIVFWRDLTSLGWPLDDQILADLRSGKPMTAQMGTASTNGTQTGAQ